MASNPPQSTFSSLGNFLSLDGTARTTMTTSPKQQQPDISIHTTFPMELLNKDGRIGIYLPEARKARIAKFHSKRKMRIWRKRIKYDCRKKLADSRPRIKGRFVKRSDMDE
jgi:CCT motif